MVSMEIVTSMFVYVFIIQRHTLLTLLVGTFGDRVAIYRSRIHNSVDPLDHHGCWHLLGQINTGPVQYTKEHISCMLRLDVSMLICIFLI